MGQLHITEIEQAIERAHKEQSKLTPEVLALPGMSSPKVRHLYNNLGNLSTRYFEVGCWKGASLISTCFGNEIKHFACDNFSEFNPDGLAKDEFERNCLDHLDYYSYANKDCFTIEKYEIPLWADLFLFDGGHSFDDHKRAVTHFFPMMADQFIFVVDDFSHPDFHAVKEGTMAGLEAVKYQYEVVKSWEIFEEGEGSVRWWNGIAIFLIQKK